MNMKRCPNTIFSSKFQALRKLSDIFKPTTPNIDNPRIGVLGISLSKGNKSNSGVEFGPEVIRNTEFIKTLENEMGYVVTDYGDIVAHSAKETLIRNVRNPEIVGHICERVSLKVEEILKNGDPVIAMGGDRSVSIGTVNGHTLVQPDMCLINVGAHADINTALTTKTSNLNGMVNSFLLMELEPYKVSLPGFEWLKPTIRAKDVVYVGLRDVEPLERLILEKVGVKYFSMCDVDRLGILEVTKKALDAVNPRRNRPIHISFDIDAYDINVAPSVAIGYPGGLTLREGLTFAEEISKTGLLTGLDIVEVNGKIGNNMDQEKTFYAIRQTILAFCGSNRAGNLPVNVSEIPSVLKVSI